MMDNIVAVITPTVKRVKIVHSSSRATLVNCIVACICCEKASAKSEGVATSDIIIVNIKGNKGVKVQNKKKS